MQKKKQPPSYFPSYDQAPHFTLLSQEPWKSDCPSLMLQVSCVSPFLSIYFLIQILFKSVLCLSFCLVIVSSKSLNLLLVTFPSHSFMVWPISLVSSFVSLLLTIDPIVLIASVRNIAVLDCFVINQRSIAATSGANKLTDKTFPLSRFEWPFVRIFPSSFWCIFSLGC